MNSTCRVWTPDVEWYNEMFFSKFIHCPGLSHARRLDYACVVGVDIIAITKMCHDVAP